MEDSYNRRLEYSKERPPDEERLSVGRACMHQSSHANLQLAEMQPRENYNSSIKPTDAFVIEWSSSGQLFPSTTELFGV
jgi:hypothetical protein